MGPTGRVRVHESLYRGSGVDDAVAISVLKSERVVIDLMSKMTSLARPAPPPSQFTPAWERVCALIALIEHATVFLCPTWS